MELETQIKEFIETHLSPSHESYHRRGSIYWSDSKWIGIIGYEFVIPKGEHRKYSAIIRKHVATIKSQLKK